MFLIGIVLSLGIITRLCLLIYYIDRLNPNTHKKPPFRSHLSSTDGIISRYNKNVITFTDLLHRETLS